MNGAYTLCVCVMSEWMGGWVGGYIIMWASVGVQWTLGK